MRNYLTIKLVGQSYKAELRKLRYQNGRIALQLVSSCQEPLATVTVNLPDEPLPPDQVFVKTWSENAGILEQLITQGFLIDTGKRVKTGFNGSCEAVVCKIPPKK